MGLKKVLVGGCFDILHYGHIHFLREAKKLGDHLIVALESDENLKRLKGSTRPIHNQKQRKEILESLKFVDKVLLLPEMKTDSDYEKMVTKIAPHIIAITKGSKTKTHAHLVGAKVVEVPKIRVSSTTQIVKLIGLE